ncbi:uncharacterized protein LOC128672311 isoform X2 [Plodia interpunctella]|uniref:uncharacterized protein LOC128672311 isoform X2 n=1 Tax=Plodia interpunctella TaxID=58824 RepID=UPI0023675C32|nr:uncharacterized protein LOC128672311 isoform X2 [Plodia interpunctella]
MNKFLLILVLFGIKYGDCKTNPNFYLLKVRSYEHDLNQSLQQDREDKQRLLSWNEEFQLKQVNLMAEYRIQMTKHRDHNFRANWEDCINIYRRTINTAESDFNDEEIVCTKSSLISKEEKRKAINQIVKEKRKWRKGYRYLEKQCKSNHDTDLEIATCIAKFVENDSYNLTLHRLISLKMKLMGELFVQYNTIIFDLGECLRINLYNYLNNVRTIVKVMQRCYHKRKN